MSGQHTKGSDERQFLHDLASPLGTALFLIDSMIDSMQSRSGTDAGELLQATEIFQALEKVKKLLHERREILIKQGIPSARS